MIRHTRLLLLIAVFLLPAFGWIACSIEEADEPPLGAISVTATDTDTGEEVVGALVLLDGRPRTERTPALLGGIDVGDHEVTLLPGIGYEQASREVTVAGLDTTHAAFDISAPVNAGEITIETNRDPAHIVLDGAVQTDYSTPTTFRIPTGSFHFSVYKEAHRTVRPEHGWTYSVETDAVDTLTFDLQAAGEEGLELGADVDQLVFDFARPSDTGDTVSVGQYRGYALLVNFWYRECAPCMQEFPEIQEVFEERSPEGFRVIAVNTGWFNDDSTEFAEVRDLGLTFPLLYNDTDPNLTYEDWFFVTEAPTNILVDREGVIRYRFGLTGYDDLNDKLDLLLEE
ncbi:redoxin domain-containing protein [bacterium]|nr:redoxin domain-containing protein [bacterium]